MRKPIIYLNLLLVLASLWMAAAVRNLWLRNHARYALATAAPRPASSRATGAAPGAAASGPLVYTELVSRNLFSSDRNNDQPPPKADKPAPPLPVVIGTLNLGSGMMVLIAEQKNASQGTFKRLRVGEEIGGYKLVEIAEHKVVVEFEGHRKTLDVYESADSVAPRGAPAYAAPASAAPGSQVQSAVPSSTATTPSAPPSAAPDAAAAAAGIATEDPTLTYVIEGNRKKYMRRTPFGTSVWYEEIPPAQKKPQ